MKKSILAVILSILIITGLWIFRSSGTFSNIDLGQSIIILVLVGFALLAAFRRYMSVKQAEPPEDELSKLIQQKASSLSFYISLYLWLIISYYSSKQNFETEQIIGYGIIGMALIFAGTWSFLKIKGLKNV